MRSRVKSCVDKWKSTLIGQDIFTRSEQVPLDKLRKKRDLDSHKVCVFLVLSASVMSYYMKFAK